MLSFILILVGVFGTLVFAPRIIQGIFQDGIGFPAKNVVYNAASVTILVAGILLA